MEKWTVADIPSQAGKLAVVTGANSGIGRRTDPARASSCQAAGGGVGSGESAVGAAFAAKVGGHPGYARTNLQTSGPGRPLNSLEKIVASFMSQDAAHGALPTLRAATATDAAQGSYYGPDRMFQLKEHSGGVR